VGKIYDDFLKDKAQILADQQYANDRAGHYNISRRALLRKLNAKLVKEHLPQIKFNYA
jgi:hypothetical protein